MSSVKKQERVVLDAAMKWYRCWTHREDSYFDRNADDRSKKLSEACAALSRSKKRKASRYKPEVPEVVCNAHGRQPSQNGECPTCAMDAE